MPDPRLLIDKYRLDSELVENPSFVQDVGDELADAIAIRDTLKEALDTITAALDLDIREELERNKKKSTENIVSAMVQMHPQRQKAFEDYSKAKLVAAKAASLQQAVSSRSDHLRVLSDLYKSGYFAINATRETPSTSETKYKLMRERLAAERLGRQSD